MFLLSLIELPKSIQIHKIECLFWTPKNIRIRIDIQVDLSIRYKRVIR